MPKRKVSLQNNRIDVNLYLNLFDSVQRCCAQNFHFLWRTQNHAHLSAHFLDNSDMATEVLDYCGCSAYKHQCQLTNNAGRHLPQTSTSAPSKDGRWKWCIWCRIHCHRLSKWCKRSNHHSSDAFRLTICSNIREYYLIQHRYIRINTIRWLWSIVICKLNKCLLYINDGCSYSIDETSMQSQGWFE